MKRKLDLGLSDRSPRGFQRSIAQIVLVTATASYPGGSLQVPSGCSSSTAEHAESPVPNATPSHRRGATDPASPNSVQGCLTLTANPENVLLAYPLTTKLSHAAVAHQGPGAPVHTGSKENPRNATTVKYNCNPRGPPRPAR